MFDKIKIVMQVKIIQINIRLIYVIIIYYGVIIDMYRST